MRNRRGVMSSTKPSMVNGSVRARARAGRQGGAGLLRRTIGCGVDVVELDRFTQAIRRGGAAFRRRIFTAQEQAYARRRRRMEFLHLAGRFAAKEAVIKALSQLAPDQVPTMKQVEVRNDRLGRPHIILHRRLPRRVQVHVSLSHVKSVAVASAIAIR